MEIEVKFSLCTVIMQTITAVLLMATVIGCVTSLKFPSYVVPCRASDPNFQQCALQHGRDAIPELVKGDKSLKIRQLDPLHIPEIKIDATGNLKMKLTDVTILGLGSAKLNDMLFDTKNRRVELDLRLDSLNVLGTYNIDGQILILPIKGRGPMNVTLEKGVIGYKFSYGIIQKDGEDYIDPGLPEVTLNSYRYYFRLENLFNGDPVLGEGMNKFLNENYRELEKELAPAVTETIKQIASEMVNNLLTLIPYNEIVLP